MKGGTLLLSWEEKIGVSDEEDDKDWLEAVAAEKETSDWG